MKSYLNFTLKGSKLLPVWLAFLIFFIIPFYYLIKELVELTAADVPANDPQKRLFLYYIIVIILSIAFTFLFFKSKLVMQSLEYKGTKIVCDYHVGKYIGIIITGIVLSIVTIGVYIPWLIKNLQRFFVHGASYNSHKFAFMGKGSKLFLILTFTFFIPFLVIGFAMDTILKWEIDIWIYQVIVISSIVSFIYLTFKWMIDIRYKSYLIKLETTFLPAMGKISIELALALILVFIFRWLTAISVPFLYDMDFFPTTGKIVIELVLGFITFGIYFPMAFIRLYRYFVEHTKSNTVEGKQISIGYDGDQLSDFLFIWRQILLTMITFGIYYPWAFSLIAHRVLAQTYLSTPGESEPDHPKDSPYSFSQKWD